jgi:hypothetical protein
MKEATAMMTLMSILSAISVMLVSSTGAKESQQTGADGSQTQSQRQGSESDVQAARTQRQEQSQAEVEKQRKEAEDEARKTLDEEAIAAIEQTQKAVDAIGAGKSDEALASIEQATGKINILLARNPATALIPVDLNVMVFDTAPRKSEDVLGIAIDASRAVDDRDYPTARALLFSLMSEIRVRIYNLPLATYPDALKQAARLLDKKADKNASSALSTALNTLVVVDRVVPIPLLLAREAINQAEAESQHDNHGAQDLLETAKREVARAKDLGYTGKDQEYEALKHHISSLEKQLEGSEDATAAFSKLKDKLSAFLKRQSPKHA